MSKRIEDLKVSDNIRLSNDFFLLILTGIKKIPVIKPGQFAQVRIDDSKDTFLRRPLSIHDVDYGNNTIKLLVQIAGKGTEKLSRLKVGDYVNLVYPLGNSFTIPELHEKIILVGGGCGIAPLLFLGKYLKNNGYSPDILLGFRNSERIIEFEEYLELGRVFLTTEDGSRGEKGFITHHSILETEEYNRVYCCGPVSMMKAVAEYSKKNKIFCEVSLENLMACGIGACLCCVVDTNKGNLCTCTEGPIFNVNDLKW
jgi:dihydroorotate dehydrogenase electron transfer subunit